MIIRALLHPTLAASAVGGVTALWLAVTRPIGVPEIPTQDSTTSVTSRRQAPANSIDSLLTYAISRAPFRASRVAARVPYDPKRSAMGVAPAMPPAPKPTPVLSGLIWGTVPTVILDGVPGVEGSLVMRGGEQEGGLKVRRIDRDRVIVVGYDTVWTLSLKEPWK